MKNVRTYENNFEGLDAIGNIISTGISKIGAGRQRADDRKMALFNMAASKQAAQQKPENKKDNTGLYITIALGILVVAAVVIFLVKAKKK